MNDEKTPQSIEPNREHVQLNAHLSPPTTQLQVHSTRNSDSNFIAQALRAVDWAFRDRKESHELEGVHPYPARFIPDIPATLLSLLPVQTDAVVFDPFCGCGTTLVEAQRRGLRSIGVDLNPIACLISQVKTSSRPRNLVRIAEAVVNKARGMKPTKRPCIPNVDHWFLPSAQDAISTLLAAMDNEPLEECKHALRLSLSSIIVRVSNQESDTRYAAVSKTVQKSDVYDAFLASCRKLDVALTKRQWQLPTAHIIESDVLQLTPESVGSRVNVVITSPPYPNAYEYWLYHKYRMWWLGFDPLAVKAREIGARAHFFKSNGHTAESFAGQMRPVFELIGKLLIRSGYACFVVGRSKIHGRIIDNASTLRELAKDCHMEELVSIERPIAANRKSFNLSHASITTETLLVFQKR